MYYFMNNENGNILTWDEMMEEAAELYDLDDPTCPFGWDEYYTLVEMEG